MLIPGRSAEVLDWLADAIGTAAGVILIYYLKRKQKFKPEFVQN